VVLVTSAATIAAEASTTMLLVSLIVSLALHSDRIKEEVDHIKRKHVEGSYVYISYGMAFAVLPD
jgi:hypothetical protein